MSVYQKNEVIEVETSRTLSLVVDKTLSMDFLV